jgi:hypothetical protein
MAIGMLELNTDINEVHLITCLITYLITYFTRSMKKMILKEAKCEPVGCGI